jgi:hypothetical protein
MLVPIMVPHSDIVLFVRHAEDEGVAAIELDMILGFGSSFIAT